MTKLKACVTGALYGFGLSLCGTILAGGGHGTYFLLGLASAPISTFGYTAAIFSPLLLWPLLALLVGAKRLTGLAFAIMIFVHYIGAVWLLSGSRFGDWKYFPNVWRVQPFVVLIGVGWYVCGQLLLWKAAFASHPRSELRANHKGNNGPALSERSQEWK